MVTSATHHKNSNVWLSSKSGDMSINACPHTHVDGVALVWPIQSQRCNRAIDFNQHPNIC
jgi:hypothetical protein